MTRVLISPSLPKPVTIADNVKVIQDVQTALVPLQTVKTQKAVKALRVKLTALRDKYSAAAAAAPA